MALQGREVVAPSFKEILTSSTRDSNHLATLPSDKRKTKEDPIVAITRMGGVGNLPYPSKLDENRVDMEQGKLVAKGSNKCIPNMTGTPTYEIRSYKLNTHIQFMKNHAIISKFMGIWYSKNALIKWIDLKWKSKGKIKIKLGSQGFFTTIFF